MSGSGGMGGSTMAAAGMTGAAGSMMAAAGMGGAAGAPIGTAGTLAPIAGAGGSAGIGVGLPGTAGAIGTNGGASGIGVTASGVNAGGIGGSAGFPALAGAGSLPGSKADDSGCSALPIGSQQGSHGLGLCALALLLFARSRRRAGAHASTRAGGIVFR